MWSHLNLDFINAHHHELRQEIARDRLANRVIQANSETQSARPVFAFILNRLAGFQRREYPESAALQPAAHPSIDNSVCCTA